MQLGSPSAGCGPCTSTASSSAPFRRSSSANVITSCRASAASAWCGRNWAFRWPGYGISPFSRGWSSLPFGENHGLEAGELPLFAEIPLFLVVATATAQFLITIGQRLEPPLYVALWYLIATFMWTTMNLVLGSFILPYTISGINSAAFHGLYIHYIVGLWLTPAGYVLIYYFLPVSARNPLFAHKLSLVGFWSLALFYPFVGIHHYLYSPIADWAETLAIITSMLLIIPVWTVLVNFFGTMTGKWHEFGRNLPAKFLIMGSLMYLVGCFQGSTEALRSIQQPTHFTDFVISHSHLTVFGTFVVWAMGGLVYVWPRIFKRELWSFSAWQLVILADHRRHLHHGPGADRRRPAAGLSVDERHRVARHRSVDETLLAGADNVRHQHGHRHVSAGHQSDDDRADQPGRGRGATAPSPERSRFPREGRPNECARCRYSHPRWRRRRSVPLALEARSHQRALCRSGSRQ